MVADENEVASSRFIKHEEELIGEKKETLSWKKSAKRKMKN